MHWSLGVPTAQRWRGFYDSEVLRNPKGPNQSSHFTPKIGGLPQFTSSPTKPKIQLEALDKSFKKRCLGLEITAPEDLHLRLRSVTQAAYKPRSIRQKVGVHIFLFETRGILSTLESQALPSAVILHFTPH